MLLPFCTPLVSDVRAWAAEVAAAATAAYQGEMRQLRRERKPPKHGNFDFVLSARLRRASAARRVQWEADQNACSESMNSSALHQVEVR